MLSLNKFFNHPQLVAFTSDSKVDYTLREAAPFLTDAQRSELSQLIGSSVNRLAWVKQVHGAEVVVVDDNFLKDGELKEADALVTNRKDVLVAVRTADCLPVFIWDPIHQAMGIVHAGWRSTQKEIVRRTCEVMAAIYQSDYEDLLIAFGPSIRSCCYQVSDEFKKYFPNAVTSREGKLYMDLIKSNSDQLLALGVKRNLLFDSCVCTVCDHDYFSYRRDGDKAGRMLSGFLLKG
jgi:YfiH family protein